MRGQLCGAPYACVLRLAQRALCPTPRASAGSARRGVSSPRGYRVGQPRPHKPEAVAGHRTHVRSSAPRATCGTLPPRRSPASSTGAGGTGGLRLARVGALSAVVASIVCATQWHTLKSWTRMLALCLPSCRCLTALVCMNMCQAARGALLTRDSCCDVSLHAVPRGAGRGLGCGSEWRAGCRPRGQGFPSCLSSEGLSTRCHGSNRELRAADLV